MFLRSESLYKARPCPDRSRVGIGHRRCSSYRAASRRDVLSRCCTDGHPRGGKLPAAPSHPQLDQPFHLTRIGRHTPYAEPHSRTGKAALRSGCLFSDRRTSSGAVCLCMSQTLQEQPKSTEKSSRVPAATWANKQVPQPRRATGPPRCQQLV